MSMSIHRPSAFSFFKSSLLRFRLFLFVLAVSLQRSRPKHSRAHLA